DETTCRDRGVAELRPPATSSYLCAKPLGLALTKVHLFGSSPTSRQFVCFLGKKLGSFVQLFTCTKRHAYKSRLLLPSAASTSLSMTKSRSGRRYNEGCAS